MTVWHGAFALLVVLTAAGLLLPSLAWRRTSFPQRAESELAIHRSRYAQIARDREHGLISAEEAAGAEAEIGRALLAASRKAAESSSAEHAYGRSWPIAAITTVLLALSLAIYGWIGSWGASDLPLAARETPRLAAPPTLASEHEGGAMQQAVNSLRQRLEKDPGNAANWQLLARSYSAVNAYAEAANAYERLIALVPQDLDIRGDYAEALIRKDEGLVGAKALEQLDIIVAHAPKDPRARYYLALHDAQAGRDREAAEGWAAILRDAPADAPYRPAIRRILDAVIEDGGLDRAALEIPEVPTPERGPSAEDVAAASEMSEQDQLAMIRSMVERLETRLEANPEDVGGWLRLARSRLVLGEREAAVAALEKGLAANPGESSLVTALGELSEGATD